MRFPRAPRIEEYHVAFQNHRHFLIDEELCECDVQKDGDGFPKGVAGGTTIAFHLVNKKKHWAVRCFHRQIPDLEQRYSALSNFMKSKNPDMFVSTECIQKGIFLNEDTHAIIKMQWVDGTRLDQFLIENYNNANVLNDFAKQFREIIQYLEREKIAHGDLQHENIIIENGKIVLIDYDGVFLPGIENLGSSEVGHRHYQHPKRCDEQPFDHRLDRFSAIVIYISILAIAENPGLFKSPDYHNQDNIIFKKTDFEDPHNSHLFNELLDQESTKYLCENFLAICKGKMENIPSLEEFISSIDLFEPQPGEHGQERTLPAESAQDATRIDETKKIQKRQPNLSKSSKKTSREQEVEKYKEKIGYCLEILEDDPNNVKHLLMLAESYYNTGDYTNALENFQKVKTLDTTASPHIDYSIENTMKLLAKENEKSRQQINHYLTLLKDYPKATKYLDPLADLYFKTGQLEKAINIIERIDRNDPRIEIIKNLLNSKKN